MEVGGCKGFERLNDVRKCSIGGGSGGLLQGCSRAWERMPHKLVVGGGPEGGSARGHSNTTPYPSRNSSNRVRSPMVAPDYPTPRLPDPGESRDTLKLLPSPSGGVIYPYPSYSVTPAEQAGEHHEG
eukprot:767414-Hanusia_phi.AAC.2